MPGLSFEHVTKSFGDVPVVEDFHLEVANGELLVLVGGSGSGKSTILRILAGLESATTGRIRIGERDVTDLPPRERDVAMVFQDYALYPHMTVRENLSLGLRLRKLPGAEITRRVTWASGILGIEALLERRPKQLSGGQRQRVAMGRAMVREPAAFLFDEPLSCRDASCSSSASAGRVTCISRSGRIGSWPSLLVTSFPRRAITSGSACRPSRCVSSTPRAVRSTIERGNSLASDVVRGAQRRSRGARHECPGRARRPI